VKITINAGALADAIALAPKNTKKSKPLAHVIADNGGIAIAVSDGNVTVNAKVPAAVTELGETCIGAEAFGDLIGAFEPEAVLELQAGAIKDGLTITCGKAHYKLPMAEKPAEELVILANDVAGVDIAGVDMLKLLSVLPAADDGKARDYLNSVCLHSDGGQLFGVATNGTVLLRTAATGAIELETVIPAASVVTMTKLLKKVKPEIVRLRRSKHLFGMSCPAFGFVTRLIGTKFPDYQRVLPKGGTAASADILRDDLALALRRLAAVAADCAATPLAALAWNIGRPSLGLYLAREPGNGADIIEASAVGEAEIVVALPALAGLVNEFDADRLHLEKTDTGALLIKAGEKLAILSSCKWKTEVAATAA
jgi:DNA polymerase III sliding clamp (beta) subunit (PCNA family)